MFALSWMKTSLVAVLTVQGCGQEMGSELLEEAAQLAPSDASDPDTSQSPPRLSVSINVNVAAGQRPISPEIYGMANATPAQLADLNIPLHRSGGNHTSRYNWQLNAFNRGSDWYFQSVPEPSATPGEAGDTFITGSRAAGAQPMLTVPMVGWVAKLGASRGKLASFSISRYGAQSDRDWQWFPDAGNGIRTNGQLVTGNNPTDASVPSTPAFQRGWVQHLVNRWGVSAAGGLRYYILDNEPSLWHATHRDVHPTGATMEQVRDRMLDYGAAVKAVDPGALLVGPEEWGWSGYLYSGYDQQYAQRNNYPPPAALPDRAAHGGWDYLPWLLDQLRRASIGTGRRALDVLSVHYYPQGGEFSNNTTQAMQLLRNRSTRSLWDPNYVDASWIADRVQLIPRLRGWVNAHYPGTRTAITEYNWGAEGHINGATAQADLLGIFGREGLDMAVRWGTPAASTPTYKAIKLYRNYDGQRSTFGDVSVSTTVPDPDTVSAFAARRSSDGALTLMVVTKHLTSGANLAVNLAGFQPGRPAQVWQLTSANTLTRKADVPLSGTSLFTSVPAASVTLFVVPAQPR
ncbi:glycoside hydrolase family 44 protein [Hyalangium gracile]|uniref:glycoside hydrolase family 44 protein n=1 Tax=Hyalangium gracile TaxID=394092 RepID=UPI001CCB19AD|nr:glycoside hydrolase family 44 protein [Hyalangium gracile]